MSEYLIKVTSTGRIGSMPDMSGRYKAVSNSNEVPRSENNFDTVNVNSLIAKEIDKRFKERDNAKTSLESRNMKRKIELGSNVDESVLKQPKYDFRERLIGRLEINYYSKVCDIQEPKKILEKLKTSKLSEANLTTMKLRERLYSIKYNPSKERASAFWNRFEDIVRMYNGLPDVKSLTDDELVIEGVEAVIIIAVVQNVRMKVRTIRMLKGVDKRGRGNRNRNYQGEKQQKGNNKQDKDQQQNKGILNINEIQRMNEETEELVERENETENERENEFEREKEKEIVNSNLGNCSDFDDIL
ncbi:hypothetical protein TSAR_008007 [Trichomalopsis sarcophagae]|uniref:Uncharacterized protein n=1 Tax=Trichomalopsis sarcophagae TaxID=543379 RepID=A0A232FNS3_9HYME|nr:hypothetical protein TSAR_008007 [Trichomalopsis sarcophagae]